MRTVNFLRSSNGGGTLVIVFTFLFFPLGLWAQILVDCSGANPNEYPSINAALQYAIPGSTILVSGTCNENVNLQGWSGLNPGASYGQTATLNGALSISSSRNIYLTA